MEKPVIGMGATLCHYSDRTACTVIAVSKSGKTCTIQEDTAERTDSNGMSESQEYTYSLNAEGLKHTVRMTKKGWYAKGTRVAMGVRSSYFDYSF